MSIDHDLEFVPAARVERAQLLAKVCWIAAVSCPAVGVVSNLMLREMSWDTQRELRRTLALVQSGVQGLLLMIAIGTASPRWWSAGASGRETSARRHGSALPSASRSLFF